MDAAIFNMHAPPLILTQRRRFAKKDMALFDKKARCWMKKPSVLYIVGNPVVALLGFTAAFMTIWIVPGIVPPLPSYAGWIFATVFTVIGAVLWLAWRHSAEEAFKTDSAIFAEALEKLEELKSNGLCKCTIPVELENDGRLFVWIFERIQRVPPDKIDLPEATHVFSIRAGAGNYLCEGLPRYQDLLSEDRNIGSEAAVAARARYVLRQLAERVRDQRAEVFRKAFEEGMAQNEK